MRRVPAAPGASGKPNSLAQVAYPIGNDKVLWPPVQDALFIDLAAGEARWRGQTSGIAGIEAVTGTAGPDEMYGDDLDNVLRGKDGDDFLDGRGSHDYLFGGNGTDSCVNGEVDTACET